MTGGSSLFDRSTLNIHTPETYVHVHTFSLTHLFLSLSHTASPSITPTSIPTHSTFTHSPMLIHSATFINSTFTHALQPWHSLTQHSPTHPPSLTPTFTLTHSAFTCSLHPHSLNIRPTHSNLHPPHVNRHPQSPTTQLTPNFIHSKSTTVTPILSFRTPLRTYIVCYILAAF